MPIRSVSDVIYTAIAWLPLLALAVGVLFAACLGIMHLEIVTPGTGVFVGDHESANMLLTGVGSSGPSDQEILDAIASGDLDRMNAVYDRVEAQQAAQHRG